MESIGKILDFIKSCEKLKDTPRSASHTSSGKRESVAEHSWRMALLAVCLLPYFPELDAKKVLTMCLIHDLPEQITGDVSAAELPDAQNKLSSERSAAADLFSLLPEDLYRLLTLEYDDYSFINSPEARFAKAIDKAETIIQHNQGSNSEDFNYAFNLEYGKAFFEDDEILKYIRSILDSDTLSHIK